jgi:phosphomannomutase
VTTGQQSSGTSGLTAELECDIAVWTEQDPDPATVTAVHDLLSRARSGEQDAVAELTDAFGGRLQFGTAGLRGALGPGPRRMNRVVVGQAAAGLARYLLDQGQAGGRVVIGYDARHNSDVFARDTAEILAGAGFDALLAEAPLPTPVLAFAIRHLDCVAGVVVTASHNPARDNGYKVYLGDGSQIVPPADAEIADRILKVTAHPLDDVPRSSAFTVLGTDVVEAYLDRLVSLVPAEAPRDLSWAYTAMHGVGADVVMAAVQRLGFPSPSVVPEQQHPDPDFPTLAFPNPEEPGAMDLVLAVAERESVDVVIANDPDADRCAVAVPGGEPGQPSWHVLRGDELGALLADDLLRRGVEGVYACSIVSSSLLASMAAAHGQPFVATLTGFKWIGRVPGLAFGYEEAIGYCVDPSAVPDKDGISALVRVLALAAALKADGHTLADRLDQITRTYGVHATDQLSVRVSDLSVISDAMARLRAEPPQTLLGEPVRVIDLATGSEDLPSTDGIRLLADSVTVVVRPSGTEPKLKCYLESRIPVADSQDVAVARSEARRRLDQVRAEVTAALGLG